MVIVNLQLKIKPEKRDEFLVWFKGLLPDTRNYDGCSELNLCSLASEPDAVDVISKWESQEKYDTYLAWRDEDGDGGRRGGEGRWQSHAERDRASSRGHSFVPGNSRISRSLSPRRP